MHTIILDTDIGSDVDGNVKRVSPSKPLEAVSAMISLIAKVN